MVGPLDVLYKGTPLRRYWLPSLAEILEKVGPNMCLSTLDLTSEFHQSAMNLVSSEMTTFVCPFGKRYLRMPFGLKNAPAVFQSVIEDMLTLSFRIPFKAGDDRSASPN